MQAALDRVMKTFGMMVNLTLEQQEEARIRLKEFLQQRTGSEEELTILGLQFLRGDRKPRRRRPRRNDHVSRSNKESDHPGDMA